MKTAAAHNAAVLPVDSEHSAIYQCIASGKREEVARLILTASGGAFRDRDIEGLYSVTVDEALQHPTWDMGRKITIDSATMMNKGLEVIEAHWLFGVSFDQIEVLIHPQSLVHSMVEFVDGSVIAQIGHNDMQLPVQYAMSYPARLSAPPELRLDFTQVAELSFMLPDKAKYPCISLAYKAGETGGTRRCCWQPTT